MYTKHVIVKFLKTKDNETNLERIHRETVWTAEGFSSETSKDKGRNTISQVWFLRPSKTILQKWGGNKHIYNWKDLK